jgi:hypothetical protein
MTEQEFNLLEIAASVQINSVRSAAEHMQPRSCLACFKFRFVSSPQTGGHDLGRAK